MPFPLGLCLNVEYNVIPKSRFPYCKCYIWKQPLKGVPSNMCSLKLGKPDTLDKDTNTLQ